MTGFVIFGTVHDVPDNFKQWVKDNGQRIKASEQKGTLPYFLKDNEKYWKDAKSVGGIVGNGQAAKVESSIVGKDAAGNPVTHEQWYGTPKEKNDVKQNASSHAEPPHMETYRQGKDSPKVFVSDLNQEAEREENVRMAKFLAEKLNEIVYVLPHIQPTSKDAEMLRKEYFPKGVKENKNPDYFFMGRFVDGKKMISEPGEIKLTKRKIQKRLNDAFKQADDVFLEIPKSFERKWIEDAVKGELNTSSTYHVVYVKHGDELLRFESKK